LLYLIRKITFVNSLWTWRSATKRRERRDRNIRPSAKHQTSTLEEEEEERK